MSKSRKRKGCIPVTVPFSAIPTGETPSIDEWAHPAIWTERMLATLNARKVRGGKWHALIDKVYSRVNLFSSADKVLGKQGAAGVDGQTVEHFESQRNQELERLHESLCEDDYCPAAVRRTWIPKPGSNEKRPLGPLFMREQSHGA